MTLTHDTEAEVLVRGGSVVVRMYGMRTEYELAPDEAYRIAAELEKESARGAGIVSIDFDGSTQFELDVPTARRLGMDLDAAASCFA